MNFVLLLPASIVAVVLVMLDNSLFDVTAFPKLHIVSILFFWTDGQDGVEFLELPRDSWAGLLLISHIVVPNSVAVGTQDDTLVDFFLDSIKTKPSIGCITNAKHFVL